MNKLFYLGFLAGVLFASWGCQENTPVVDGPSDMGMGNSDGGSAGSGSYQHACPDECSSSADCDDRRALTKDLCTHGLCEHLVTEDTCNACGEVDCAADLCAAGEAARACSSNGQCRCYCSDGWRAVPGDACEALGLAEGELLACPDPEDSGLKRACWLFQNPWGDFDGDGIANHAEMLQFGTDPCRPEVLVYHHYYPGTVVQVYIGDPVEPGFDPDLEVAGEAVPDGMFVDVALAYYNFETEEDGIIRINQMRQASSGEYRWHMGIPVTLAPGAQTNVAYHVAQSLAPEQWNSLLPVPGKDNTWEVHGTMCIGYDPAEMRSINPTYEVDFEELFWAYGVRPPE